MIVEAGGWHAMRRVRGRVRVCAVLGWRGKTYLHSRTRLSRACGSIDPVYLVDSDSSPWNLFCLDTHAHQGVSILGQRIGLGKGRQLAMSIRRFHGDDIYHRARCSCARRSAGSAGDGEGCCPSRQQAVHWRSGRHRDAWLLSIYLSISLLACRGLFYLVGIF